MTKIKKYYWVLPLIGGTLSIIGLFIPAWYSITAYDENLWMWGLIEHISVGGVYDFLPAELLIPGLITAILILMSSIVIIIFALFIVRGKEIRISAEILWIIMGFLELCAVIIYIVAMDMGWYSYTQRINYSIHDFWRIYNFQFGMITPFIGAALSIVGAINELEALVSKIKPVNNELYFWDSTRSKWLSIAELPYDFSDTNADGKYLRIGDATGTNMGYLLPLDATIVKVTVTTEGGNATKGFQIRKNGAAASL